MKCFSCETPVPLDALAPNFCITCGKPLTQPCPYELAAHQPGGPPTYRLPLCSEDGRATMSCDSCGGLLKACDTCLRLYKLDSTDCGTPDCPGKLHEPIAAYPGGAGAFDGAQSRLAIFLEHAPKQTMTQTLDGLQALAFRYGLLIAVTRRNIGSYRWNGLQWQQVNVQGLVPSGELAVRSLQIEQGRAFVLGQDRALVFSLLNGLSRQSEAAGTFLHQAVGPRWWLRVASPDRLLLTECETWQTTETRLPPQAGEVTALACDAHVYLATARGHVYKVDATSGQATPIVQQKHRWARIAVQNDRMALLGYDESDNTGRMILRVLSTDGKTTYGERALPSGTIPDFAWVENSLYLARQMEQDRFSLQSKNVLETYDARQLTGSPAVVNLTAGTSTEAGMLALVGAEGQTRLLLRRIDHAEQQWSLVNPASSGGKQELPRPILDYITASGPDVDGWPADAPLLCVADTRLVSALREGGKTILRTYETLENP